MHTAHAEIDAADPTRILVSVPFRSNDAAKAVPGCRWSGKDRSHVAPLTWNTCLALRGEFGAGLTIGDELKAWAFIEKKRREDAAALHGLLELPDGVTLPPLPGVDKLFPYQGVDALLAQQMHRVLLMNQTGTGKTWSALAGMSLLDHSGHNIFPLLVVAPKSMVITWARDEIPRFFAGADIRTCVGTPSKMRKALEPGGDIYVIGWGGLRTYSRHAHFGKAKVSDKEKEPNAIAFKAAIIDEVHRAKDTGSKQTRALWPVTDECSYVIALTGTPIESTPDDMWPLLRATRGQHEYGHKTQWMDRFLQIDPGFWGGFEIKGLHPATAPEFLQTLDTISRRTTKAQALPWLPDKSYQTRWVSLPPKFRAAYNSMRDHYLTELDDGTTVAASNPLVASSRLTQFAQGLVEEQPDGSYKLVAPLPKVDAFMDDLKDGDFGDQKLVVFSDSRQTADILCDELSKAGRNYVVINGDSTDEERDLAKASFQSMEAGSPQIIVCTRAGSEGITLTAASTMVRLVRSWSSVTYEQAEDRVHRIGSEIHDKVVYVDYVTEDTVEEKQLVKMAGKHSRAQEITRDNVTELLR